MSYSWFFVTLHSFAGITLLLTHIACRNDFWKPRCKYCPMSVTSYNCLRENGNCYIIGCDVGNWFGARDLCERMNGSLVIAENENSAKEVKRVIDTLGIGSCDSFWLGTRHSDWFVDSGEGRTLLYRSLWYDDQPESASTKTCAYLFHFFKGIYLYSSSCDAEYPFFCIKAMNMPAEEVSDVLTRQPFGNYNNTESLSTITVKAKHNGTMTSGIVLIVLGIVFIIVACIVLCLILAKREIIRDMFIQFGCIGKNKAKLTLKSSNANRVQQNDMDHFQEEIMPMEPNH